MASPAPDPRDGQALHDLAARLLPLPRSLTGDGVRATLGVLAEILDLTVHEVPTGTPALDWTVPQEWNLRRAWLQAPDGSVVADTDRHALAVVGYSQPVDRILPLEELQPHLHSLPALPDAIPYRTSYYVPAWGFCLPDRVRRDLPAGDYRARIDARMAPGALSYGEVVLPGAEDGVVLLSAHVCHPGMANDNCAGIVVAAAVAAALAARPQRRWTYRILFAPGTLGALVWLARNPEVAALVRNGLVLAGLGDRGPLTYKRSRAGNREIDLAVATVLRDRGAPHTLQDFVPWGYDERQYGSPGFDLSVGLLQRTPHGTYPEYHTSADDLGFIAADQLADSAEAVLAVLDVLESNARPRNLAPYGEPRLGSRGLYPGTGGRAAGERQLALLWVLSLADGATDLVAMAARSGLPYAAVRDAADALAATDLLAT